MSSIYDWSLLAASNANSDDNINWAEGQPPSSVNNSARSMMQRVRELISDLGGITAATGTANIITFAAKSSFAAYVDGIRLSFRAANTNTGAATLNVNSVGAKPIYAMSVNTGIVALARGNITANGIYEVVYSSALDSGSGGWLLLNPSVQFAPVGSLVPMASPITPDGYLYCNGQAISRTTYATLFAFLGTRYGAGNGTTTFNLPDYRSVFLRGWDDGRGLDSGRIFGAYQASQNLAHTHSVAGSTVDSGAHEHILPGVFFGNGVGTASAVGGAGNPLVSSTGVTGGHTHTFQGTAASSGGSEARPVNNTVYWVVKY